MASLVHVSDDEPGIERRGTSTFRYVRQSSRAAVRDERELARIRGLAIPPAWTDVWICADPEGHIQATGRDARGRKQYRYHPAFRRRRERRKFEQLIPFGESLGSLRTAVDGDLRRHDLSRERVVAAVVSLLDCTCVRLGNEAYARTNRSFGLSTLRCKHVDVDGTRLEMRFVSKGGKWAEVSCCDARLARVVRRCQELPGQLLFQYEQDGTVCPISSTDVNDYIREASEFDATAKTFRTWGATRMAAEMLAAIDAPQSQRGSDRRCQRSDHDRCRRAQQHACRLQGVVRPSDGDRHVRARRARRQMVEWTIACARPRDRERAQTPARAHSLNAS